MNTTEAVLCISAVDTCLPATLMIALIQSSVRMICVRSRIASKKRSTSMVSISSQSTSSSQSRIVPGFWGVCSILTFMWVIQSWRANLSERCLWRSYSEISLNPSSDRLIMVISISSSSSCSCTVALSSLTSSCATIIGLSSSIPLPSSITIFSCVYSLSFSIIIY
ncbi:hypothetical protein FGO68_gene12268 [Halteria grandinella]|uniref:Uncharacterized protein n=1 Tax=Halteria grandinella TaxID=5974 RepID=A0A8J8NAG1_HALGN|nr:hypothetical protein FGO68_gene12268 [Halteria grandinella]